MISQSGGQQAAREIDAPVAHSEPYPLHPPRGSEIDPELPLESFPDVARPRCFCLDRPIVAEYPIGQKNSETRGYYFLSCPNHNTTDDCGFWWLTWRWVQHYRRKASQLDWIEQNMGSRPEGDDDDEEDDPRVILYDQGEQSEEAAPPPTGPNSPSPVLPDVIDVDAPPVSDMSLEQLMQVYTVASEMKLAIYQEMCCRMKDAEEQLANYDKIRDIMAGRGPTSKRKKTM